METRYIVYLCFFNWAWVATIVANRLDNPTTYSEQTDMAYACMCIGVQLWLALFWNMDRIIKTFKKS